MLGKQATQAPGRVWGGGGDTDPQGWGHRVCCGLAIARSELGISSFSMEPQKNGAQLCWQGKKAHLAGWGEGCLGGLPEGLVSGARTRVPDREV